MKYRGNSEKLLTLTGSAITGSNKSNSRNEVGVPFKSKQNFRRDGGVGVWARGYNDGFSWLLKRDGFKYKGGYSVVVVVVVVITVLVTVWGDTTNDKAATSRVESDGKVIGDVLDDFDKGVLFMPVLERIL